MSFILLGILNSQVEASAAGGYELLETTTAGGSSITFSNLNTYSDYKHLQVRYVTRLASTGGSYASMWSRFNSDTSSNYAYHIIQGRNGSDVNADASTNQSMILSSWTTDAGSASNVFGAGVYDLLDFNSTSKFKTLRALSGAIPDSGLRVALMSGLWRSTSAVTSWTILADSGNSSFASGSKFSLYGLRG